MSTLLKQHHYDILQTAKIYRLKDRFDFIPGFELLGLAFSSKIQHTAA